MDHSTLSEHIIEGSSKGQVSVVILLSASELGLLLALRSCCIAELGQRRVPERLEGCPEEDGTWSFLLVFPTSPVVAPPLHPSRTAGSSLLFSHISRASLTELLPRHQLMTVPFPEVWLQSSSLELLGSYNSNLSLWCPVLWMGISSC